MKLRVQLRSNSKKTGDLNGIVCFKQFLVVVDNALGAMSPLAEWPVLAESYQALAKKEVVQRPVQEVSNGSVFGEASPPLIWKENASDPIALNMKLLAPRNTAAHLPDNWQISWVAGR